MTMTNRPFSPGSLYISIRSGTFSGGRRVICDLIPYFATTFNISSICLGVATKQPLIFRQAKTASKALNLNYVSGTPNGTQTPCGLRVFRLHSITCVSSVQTMTAVRPTSPDQALTCFSVSLGLEISKTK